MIVQGSAAHHCAKMRGTGWRRNEHVESHGLLELIRGDAGECCREGAEPGLTDLVPVVKLPDGVGRLVVVLFQATDDDFLEHLLLSLDDAGVGGAVSAVPSSTVSINR